MNKNTKIFKLVSGEEIIGNLLNNDNDSVLKIENPMVFKTTTMLDTRGVPHDVVILCTTALNLIQEGGKGVRYRKLHAFFPAIAAIESA